MDTTHAVGQFTIPKEKGMSIEKDIQRGTCHFLLNIDGYFTGDLSAISF